MDGFPIPNDPTEAGDLEARMVIFGLTARTGEAQGLLERVLAAVESWEAAEGVRTRKRSQKALASLKIALESIVAAAVWSIEDGTEGRVHRALSETTWSKEEPVGFLTMKTALDGLAGAGLLTKIKSGFYRRHDFGGRGKAARWQVTPRFRAMMVAAGVESAGARLHFGATKPSESIVVKAAKVRNAKGKKIAAPSLPVPDTARARMLRQEVEEIDAYLARHQLQGGHHDGYRRVFNDGDLEGFAFDRGGRLQSVGANSYQSLSATERLKMRIDGEPVVEIDIRASQFSILHAAHHRERELPEDPYAVDGLPRDVVKGWVTVALGHQRVPTRWPSEWTEKLQSLGLDTKLYRIKDVGQKMTDRFPFLRRLEVLWGATKLQYFESNIIVSTMLRLLRESDVPSLAMHDGIIVKAKDEAIACAVLETEFAKKMRVKPRLTVDRS